LNRNYGIVIVFHEKYVIINISLKNISRWKTSGYI